jgi:transposase
MLSPRTNPSQDDLAHVRSKLLSMAQEGRFDELVELVVGLLARVRDENTALAARLQNALRMLYGRRTEKVSAEQLTLMLDALGKDAPEAAREAIEEPPPEPPNAEPKRPPPHKGRTALPAHLPRKPKTVRVPEAERKCAECGAEKTCIGYIRSEVLEFVPAQFVVVEEDREKVACPACQAGVVAAPSEKVMDRGRPGPGLLAKIVVDKFEDAMPLYRQAKEYERMGVRLSPSTLGDWSAFAVDVLEPLWRRIAKTVLSSGYVRCDDTGLRVLDRDHPQGVKKGHVWAYVGDGLVVFHYTPNWSADGPAAFLKGFRGHLQGDGYAGYDKILAGQVHQGDDEIVAAPLVSTERRLGCGMHIRRKFEEASKLGDARGAVALALIRRIYELERDYKDRGLSAEERLAERTARSVPIVGELYRWIHDIHPQQIPSMPLYKATRYAIKHEAAWRRCFSDGRFEIDNGEVERRLRWVALGRKNFLFAGSDRGAERLAIAYTVTGSCHMNGVNPLAYLTDVIEKLQSGWPKDRLDELLPNLWKPELVASEG